MIVLVAGGDVEGHAPELLFRRVLAQPEPVDDAQGLFVRNRARLVEVVVGQRPEGLHVDLAARGRAVETPGHEVMPAGLVQDPAFGHPDAGRPRHEVIRVFDQPVTRGIFQFPVPVAGHAVELEQPVGKAVAGLDLPRANLIGLGIPGDDGFRAGAARRGADAQEVLQGPLAAGRRQGAFESRAPGEDLAGELDERCDMDGRRPVGRAPGGEELERAHAAPSDIAEAFDGVEVARVASLPGEPGIDERSAEAVGERVREQARQAVEGLASQRRKRVDLA